MSLRWWFSPWFVFFTSYDLFLSIYVSKSKFSRFILWEQLKCLPNVPAINLKWFGISLPKMLNCVPPSGPWGTIRGSNLFSFFLILNHQLQYIYYFLAKKAPAASLFWAVYISHIHVYIYCALHLLSCTFWLDAELHFVVSVLYLHCNDNEVDPI